MDKTVLVPIVLIMLGLFSCISFVVKQAVSALLRYHLPKCTTLLPLAKAAASVIYVSKF